MRPNQSLPFPFRNPQLFNLIQFTDSKISWLEEETSSGQCPADKLLAPITVLQKTGRFLNTPDSVFQWLPASPPTPFSHDLALPWLCHRVYTPPSSFLPISCNPEHPLTTGREMFPLTGVCCSGQSHCSGAAQTPAHADKYFGHTQALLGVNTPCSLIFPQYCSRNVSLACDSTTSAMSEHFLLQQQSHREKAILPWLEASQEKRICP